MYAGPTITVAGDRELEGVKAVKGQRIVKDTTRKVVQIIKS
jgi:hypothetical protein